MLPSALLTYFIILVSSLVAAEDSQAYVPSTHTSNWAVLVSTSRFWFNYRHLSNTLSLYRTVKRLGIPDSQIILMLPDDMACNPRNAFPGTVYSNSDRRLDLYDTQGGQAGTGAAGGIEVDYRGYEVTVENFIRLLTDRWDDTSDSDETGVDESNLGKARGRGHGSGEGFSSAGAANGGGGGVPQSKRLLTDSGSNILVYLTGHGGNEFLKFQDSEEISSWDLADAFAQMKAKRRYNEMLFMVDTCQANTLYTQFYSSGIIATGSSEKDESSYSHHADNDVGVAVIDRWTYYVLEFLEGVGQGSEKTLGDLFDSYDIGKIHSNPGLRWDLFPGGEEAGRRRRVVDFFGNVQGVEMGSSRECSESDLEQDLEGLRKLIEEYRGRAGWEEANTTLANGLARSRDDKPDAIVDNDADQRGEKIRLKMENCNTGVKKRYMQMIMAALAGVAAVSYLAGNKWKAEADEYERQVLQSTSTSKTSSDVKPK